MSGEAVHRGAPDTEPAYQRLVRGELLPWESRQVFARYKVVASDDTTNGRGLTIAGADPNNPLTGVTVRDCMIQGDGDDAFLVWGAAKGIRVRRTWVQGLHQYLDPLNFANVNKCFTAGADPEWPDPAYPDWFRVSDCTLGGGFRCPHIRGGTFRFLRTTFGPSRRNELIRPRGDFVNCNFTVQVGMHVSGGPNPWSDSETVFVRPLIVTGPQPDSLYFSGCTLTVLNPDNSVLIQDVPATGPDLCRLNPDDGTSLVGLDLSCPSDVFRAKPNR